MQVTSKCLVSPAPAAWLAQLQLPFPSSTPQLESKFGGRLLDCWGSSKSPNPRPGTPSKPNQKAVNLTDSCGSFEDSLCVSEYLMQRVRVRRSGFVPR